MSEPFISPAERHPFLRSVRNIPMLGGFDQVNDKRVFQFTGSCQSLQSRVEALSEEELSQIVDANIMVSGIQIKPTNTKAFIWTAACSILIFPMILMCTDCWKRHTLPAFDIPIQIYESLFPLLRAPNFRNLTLCVADHVFNGEKANLLYNMLSAGSVRGFTFINFAGSYDFKDNSYSEFEKHMAPIKGLKNMVADIRWLGSCESNQYKSR
jgi:hypothetical protein